MGEKSIERFGNSQLWLFYFKFVISDGKATTTIGY